MSGRLVYLIGQPGAGKTTVADCMTETFARVDIDQPLPHRAWLNPDGTFAFVSLGRHREGFGGTDTLAMNVQPKVVDWLTSPIAPRVVFGEGDRLGNLKFHDAMKAAGWDVTMVYLDTPDGEASVRRRDRGSNQDPTWVKGRISKARTLADVTDAIRLDGLDPPKFHAHVLLKEMGLG